jgi:hypothetical protein
LNEIGLVGKEKKMREFDREIIIDKYMKEVENI